MSTRQAKQIVYGALYALLWVFIIFAGYSWFVKPAPSCFDNVKNQNEEGVDCGGVCGVACGLAGAQALSATGGVTVFTTTPGHYTLLAQVQNPNADFAAKSFDYTFDIYTPAGTVAASIPGQSFIYANEVKYLVLPNEEFSGPIGSAGITITRPQWVKASNGGTAPQFKFQNVQGSATVKTISIGGQVTNADIAAFDAVLIVGIFKSTQGAILGASQTEIDHFAPNQTQNFTVIYPSIPGIDPSAGQVFAYGSRP